MKNKALILGAAVSGLLLTTSCTTSQNVNTSTTAAKGECHGVNKCKGTGACGGKGHGCAGKNSCKGKGWLSLTEKQCTEKAGRFKI